MQKTKITLLVSSFIVNLAYAEEKVEEKEETIVLDEVKVSAGSFSQQIGTQKLIEAQIKRRAATNGNITELLKTNPNVRFSTLSDNSTSGGEIAPSEVSFHGEKFYNNNYVLDGMSNNDNMNPGSSAGLTADTQPSGTNAYDLPAGGTQSFWVNTNLLKSVEAFDSNISAKYGNFTGGVIDAKLKDPEFKRTGSVSYRTTRDGLADFHVDDDKTFEEASELNNQPKFKKHQYGLVVNEQISNNAAVRFSYQKTESDIKYYHPTLKKRNADGSFSEAKYADKQRRTNETYMLQGIYLPDNGDVWRSNIIYSPHTAKYLKKNTLNGAFTNRGGGVQASLEWEKQLEQVKMTTFLGYKKTGNKVRHDADNYYRYQVTDSFDWRSTADFAQYGGFATFRDEKTTYTVKQDFTFTEFDWGAVQHKFIAGWKMDFSQAKYVRDTESINYTFIKPTNSIALQCNGAEACINGEQYANVKQVFYARNVKAKDNSYSAYIEDQMKWKRLEFTAGLRIDYNQYLGKTNFAHRLSTTYDLFGDESTRIFGGLNRYYAGSMLASKMRDGISNNLRYRRRLNSDGSVSEWSEPTNTSISVHKSSQLDNPYTDETVLGLSQHILGSNWTFKWVRRNARDQFVTKPVYYTNANGALAYYNTMSNDGWSKNDSFTLSFSPLKLWETRYAKVNWDIGASYNRTKTNSRWYNDNKDNTIEYSIYNNQLYHTPNGATPQDFNNPWQAFININTEFPKWRLTWDQRISYIGGKDYIYSNDSINCNGANTSSSIYRAACQSYVGEVNVFKDAHQASHLLVDWRITYKQPIIKEQFIELSLDINNVLNKRAVAKSTGGNTVYKMGRNFWLGASYTW